MPFKLVCFDLDQTLIDDEERLGFWTRLHRELDTEEGIRRNVERVEAFKRGDFSYPDWVRMDLETFRELGATKQDFERVARKQKLMAGAKEVIDALQREGYVLGVISGSLDILLDTLFPEHPFDEVFANRIRFARDGTIAGWEVTAFDQGTKGEALRQLCEREGILLDEAVFVGDGENDIDALEAAGLGIAFCPEKDAVSQAADVTLKERDLRGILPHLRPKT